MERPYPYRLTAIECYKCTVRSMAYCMCMYYMYGRFSWHVLSSSSSAKSSIFYHHHRHTFTVSSAVVALPNFNGINIQILTVCISGRPVLVLQYRYSYWALLSTFRYIRTSTYEYSVRTSTGYGTVLVQSPTVLYTTVSVYSRLLLQYPDAQTLSRSDGRTDGRSRSRSRLTVDRTVIIIGRSLID